MNSALENAPTTQLMDETIEELLTARAFWVRGGSASLTSVQLDRVRFLLGSVQARLDAHMGD